MLKVKIKVLLGYYLKIKMLKVKIKVILGYIYPTYPAFATKNKAMGKHP